jgi:hypothetical protein
MLDEYELKPDFIKCDVDGAELAVVQGGLDTFRECPYSLIECYFNKDNAEDISLLISRHFTKTSDYLFH